MEISILPQNNEVNNSLEVVKEAENEYLKKIRIKKVAFLTLGLTGMGCAAIAAPLLNHITPDIYPMVVAGTIGLASIATLLVKHLKEDLQSNIWGAEADLLESYHNLNKSESDKLYSSRGDLPSTIGKFREKYLSPEKMESKITIKLT